MEQEEEQLKKELSDLGERLAMLLVAADLPVEVKTAWAALIPNMSLDQLDRLSGVLESHVRGGVQAEFADFRTALENMKSAYASKEHEVKAKAEKELDDIASYVDSK